jgi:CHASE3 domain sensor protein
MKRDTAYRLLSQYTDIQELGRLVEEREQLRRIFAVMQDAYHVTQNGVFVQLQNLIGTAGKGCNEEIAAMMQRINTEHVDGDFTGHLPSEGEGL